MGKAQDKGPVAASYDSPNQSRAKRAVPISPLSKPAGNSGDVDPLVLEKEVLSEGEEIDPDETLDVVPRREFNLSFQKSEVIVSRGCHPVCGSQSQPYGVGVREIPLFCRPLRQAFNGAGKDQKTEHL